MRVRWLRKALTNLDEEAAFIASEDPAAPYRVRGGVVEILRVFHTSRRPPGRW